MKYFSSLVGLWGPTAGKSSSQVSPKHISPMIHLDQERKRKGSHILLTLSQGLEPPLLCSSCILLRFDEPDS